MPSRKWGGNPEEAGIPSRLEKDGYLSETHFEFLGDTPKKPTKEEKRVAPSHPEDRLPKKGKGAISPNYAAEILKAMKAKVDPQNSGAEALSIRRTRREEILLVLKRGGVTSRPLTWRLIRRSGRRPM